ncbi:aldose 1-epimerase [Aureliella helgolandensis]|uniref:Aldose 1-epimerase n=1 Tax=Aureliella helgolandensis TaxID=2527968 RepID=A0A518GGW5_9BACT|nr:aldose 1-epimerase [Aureliella helgolandensis]QDV27823.1 Aldose 1-epimerase [Aureliella helgolandensis]
MAYSIFLAIKNRPTPHFLASLVWLVCWVVHSTASAEVNVLRKAANASTIYQIQQGDTVVRFAPQAGANLFSIAVDEVEYLRQPDSLEQLPGVSFGTPLLYPTPNRVKGAEFTFEGKRVTFDANSSGNFIHGLVNRYAWQVVSLTDSEESTSLRCLADFGDGKSLNDLFPFAHRLYLTITVKDRAVRWTYQVDNQSGSEAIPFGFALHPYFVYQGARDATFLTIPASHWMESSKQLPTGKLVPATELDYPLGQPMSLAETQFDDAFWGMQPDQPTTIDFRDAKRKVVIHASEAFTHLVVWTPDQHYFGIESQTCSTDAHNLHSAGMVDAAHLQICPAGETRSGWVEYRFLNGQ